DGGFLLPVTDDLGEGEGRGDHVEDAEGQEGADPAGVLQVADADDGDAQRDAERDARLSHEGIGGSGAQWSAHAPIVNAAAPARLSPNTHFPPGTPGTLPGPMRKCRQDGPGARRASGAVSAHSGRQQRPRLLSAVIQVSRRYAADYL